MLNICELLFKRRDGEQVKDAEAPRRIDLTQNGEWPEVTLALRHPQTKSHRRIGRS
jgi:hypothetical protein